MTYGYFTADISTGVTCAHSTRPSPGCASGVLRNGHSFPPADAFVVSLCDSIALIDPPVLRYLPTPDMACSGYIERLFSNSFVTFDTESGTIKVRK